MQHQRRHAYRTIQNFGTTVHSLSQRLEIGLFEPTSRSVSPDEKAHPTFNRTRRASADPPPCFRQTGRSAPSSGPYRPVVCYLSENVLYAPASEPAWAVVRILRQKQPRSTSQVQRLSWRDSMTAAQFFRGTILNRHEGAITSVRLIVLCSAQRCIATILLK